MSACARIGCFSNTATVRLTSLPGSPMVCASCAEYYVEHEAARDREMRRRWEAEDARHAASIAEERGTVGMDDTVHVCAVCGDLTAHEYEMCSRCEQGTDDYSGSNRKWGSKL